MKKSNNLLQVYKSVICYKVCYLSGFTLNKKVEARSMPSLKGEFKTDA